VRELLKGKPDPLTSQFRLGYSMILNLMRAESQADPGRWCDYSCDVYLCCQQLCARKSHHQLVCDL
jgi:superfamily II RNA helicase